MQTERQKMGAGTWYTCIDDELEALRSTARAALHEHNTMPPHERGNMGPKLRSLLKARETAIIEGQFHCAYGFNLELGESVFLNVGCTVLDTAKVKIADGTALGPYVQIYCAEHHLDRVKRSVEGLEVARPVSIGEQVWIGGGAIILPGVTIGDGAVIGAGSVVTRNVAADQIVAGNPARPIRRREG